MPSPMILLSTTIGLAIYAAAYAAPQRIGRSPGPQPRASYTNLLVAAPPRMASHPGITMDALNEVTGTNPSYFFNSVANVATAFSGMLVATAREPQRGSHCKLCSTNLTYSPTSTNTLLYSSAAMRESPCWIQALTTRASTAHESAAGSAPNPLDKPIRPVLNEEDRGDGRPAHAGAEDVKGGRSNAICGSSAAAPPAHLPRLIQQEQPDMPAPSR